MGGCRAQRGEQEAAVSAGRVGPRVCGAERQHRLSLQDHRLLCAATRALCDLERRRPGHCMAHGRRARAVGQGSTGRRIRPGRHLRMRGGVSVSRSMLPATQPSAQSDTALYTSVAVFLLGAIALVVESGYSGGAALLLLGGLYSLFTRPALTLSREDTLVLGVLVAFGLVQIFDLLIHEAGSRHMDKPLRFLLATLVFWVVRKYPPRLSWLWAGLAVGGILTASWAGYQKLFLQAERALGYTHVIQFGNIAMLTGLFCLAGLGWAGAQPQRRVWVPLLVAGAVGAVLGSLFSGSRGGWVGLPLVLLVLYRAYREYFSRRMRILALTVLAVAAGV